MNDEKVILPFRVTKETRRQLKIHAAVNSTSVNKMLTRAVEEILKGEPTGRRETVAA